MAAIERPLLAIHDLAVKFPSPSAADGGGRCFVHVGHNEIVCVVGESGSGKSVTMQAAVGLVQAKGGQVTAGSVKFDGQELIGLPHHLLNRIRGDDIGFIFQEPMSSLNPAYTVGEQIAEVVRRHRGKPGRWLGSERSRCSIACISRRPLSRAKDYPHQFSGGMRQRVMIAIASPATRNC